MSTARRQWKGAAGRTCAPQPRRGHRRRVRPVLGWLRAHHVAEDLRGEPVAPLPVARAAGDGWTADEREQHEVAWALGELFERPGRPELGGAVPGRGHPRDAGGVALDAVLPRGAGRRSGSRALDTLGTPAPAVRCRPGSALPGQRPRRCWRRWATGSGLTAEGQLPAGDGARPRRPLPVDRGVPVDARRRRGRRTRRCGSCTSTCWRSGCWSRDGRPAAPDRGRGGLHPRHRAAVAGDGGPRAALDPGVRARRARGDGRVGAALRGLHASAGSAEEMTQVLAGKVASGRRGPVGAASSTAPRRSPMSWYQLGVPLGWWDTGRGPADRHPNVFGAAAAAAVFRAVAGLPRASRGEAPRREREHPLVARADQPDEPGPAPWRRRRPPPAACRPARRRG